MYEVITKTIEDICLQNVYNIYSTPGGAGDTLNVDDAYLTIRLPYTLQYGEDIDGLPLIDVGNLGILMFYQKASILSWITLKCAQEQLHWVPSRSNPNRCTRGTMDLADPDCPDIIETITAAIDDAIAANHSELIQYSSYSK